MITLSANSLAKLQGVHPDLVKVVKRAATLATPDQDFTVIQGLRTEEECRVNYGKGRTAAECEAKGVSGRYAQPSLAKVTWLANPYASKHTKQKDGFGHAVDMMPYPIDWKDAKRLASLAKLMASAALQEGVNIVYGGSWAKSPDLDHWELA